LACDSSSVKVKTLTLENDQQGLGLRVLALAALEQWDIEKKLALVAQLPEQASSQEAAQSLTCDRVLPGRPTTPELITPLKVPRRSLASIQGRTALIHALAHIEFNAINLALDAIWRFPNMPLQYYSDWAFVAREEALHFQLLQTYLHDLNSHYGAFQAHDGLWAMVERTTEDVLARMALVPRTLEARGLDASKVMLAKLKQAGDQRAADIVQRILTDEIGHVAIGNTWYRFCCQQQNKDPEGIFAQLCELYKAPKLRGPLNLEARRQAGFTETELITMQNTI
jgi:uncharacterized ferritin-like protein (DUF455 family)